MAHPRPSRRREQGRGRGHQEEFEDAGAKVETSSGGPRMDRATKQY